MSQVLDQDEVVQLSGAEVEELWSHLRPLAGELVQTGDGDPDPLDCGAPVITALPVRVLRALHRYRNHGSAHDALLIRGLLPETLEIEPTPTVFPGPRETTTRLIECCLLGILSLLGEPFTFAGFYKDRLAQEVFPMPGAEESQTSGSSEAMLDWHVEEAFRADRCDYFALFGLRQDDAVTTLFTSVKTMRVDAESWKLLRQPRFKIRPDVVHTALPESCASVSLISGPEGDPEVCYDSLYMEPADGADEEAATALQCFKDNLVQASTGHVMRRGDLLILDNLRIIHARTAFRPRFDGTDRWLMRAMVCSSLRQQRRRGGLRVIPARSTAGSGQ